MDPCSAHRAPAPWRERAPFFAVGALVAACLAVALVTLAYATAVDDDLDFAVEGGRGAWAFARHQYLTWSGRWASFAVLGGVLHAVDPLRVYPWLVLATWCVLLFGIATCARTLLGERARRRHVLGVSLATFAALWLVPDSAPVADALYWFSGSVTYTLSLALALVAVGLAARAQPVGATRTSAAVAAALFTAAFHEVAGALLLTALVVVMAASRRRERGADRTSRRVAAILIAAALGLAIVAFAPGNALRAADGFEAARAENGRLAPAAFRVAHHGWWWLRDVAFWGALATAFVLAARLVPEQRRALAGSARRRWSLALGTPLVAGLALAVPTFVTGGWIPHRMVFVGHASFVLIGLAAAASCGAHAGPRLGRRDLASALALTLLAAGVLHESNLRRGVADLVSGRAQRFAAALDARHAAARSGGDLVLAPIERPHPRLLRASVMADDPAHWANRDFARFFGADSVVVRREP